MKVADTRASLILALKNDKNSARWEEFVNQYYDYLHYAAYQVDSETGRFRFVPDGVDPDEAVEQTFWQLKNIILPDVPQFDVDFTESQLEKKAQHGLKWKIFELERGKKFRNYLLSVLKNGREIRMGRIRVLPQTSGGIHRVNDTCIFSEKIHARRHNCSTDIHAYFPAALRLSRRTGFMSEGNSGRCSFCRFG